MDYKRNKRENYKESSYVRNQKYESEKEKINMENLKPTEINR